MKKILITCLLYCSVFSAEPSRGPSYPFISGDGFRSYCDFIIDETDNTLQNFNPQDVKEGSTIFLKTDFLEHFFQRFHPLIPHRYILVTHNCDYAIPGSCSVYLDDPKLIAWFGQNVDRFQHPKLHPIPIGVANSYWHHGKIEVFKEVQELSKELPKKNWLYLNFEPWTYPQERTPVYEKFRSAPFCKRTGSLEPKSFLLDLAESMFVLSPRGNGLDTHRTWETLLMGAIPIVRTSALDPMFDELPVLIIQDWNEITLEFLESKWEEMKSKKYNMEKLYAEYWLNLISSYKPTSAN